MRIKPEVVACGLGNGVDETLADELPLAFLAQLLVRSRDIMIPNAWSNEPKS